MSWAKWLGVASSDEVEELLDTLSWCNQAAATTNANASSVALANAASCGARFEHSVAAALLTFGGKHGPAGEARELVYRTERDEIVSRLENEEILPGWGNAFYKKSIDPAFVPMNHLLCEKYRSHSEKLDEISELIFKVTGHVLYPNAAAFNGIAAELLGLVRGTELLLVIVCRLPAWSKQYVGAQG